MARPCIRSDRRVIASASGLMPVGLYCACKACSAKPGWQSSRLQRNGSLARRLASADDHLVSASFIAFVGVNASGNLDRRADCRIARLTLGRVFHLELAEAGMAVSEPTVAAAVIAPKTASTIGLPWALVS